MIKKKDLEETRFFTTDGTDIWCNVQVRHISITQVILKNLETVAECVCTVDDANEPWLPVRMPNRMPKMSGKKRSPGPEPTAQVVKQKRKKRKRKDPPVHIAGHRGPRNQFSKFKGVTLGRLKKDGSVSYRANFWDGKKNIHLGTYDDEFRAAAEVALHKGDTVEADRLMELSAAGTLQAKAVEQADNKPEMKEWLCTHCKLEMRHPTQPMRCIRCDSASFKEVKVEIEPARNAKAVNP